MKKTFLISSDFLDDPKIRSLAFGDRWHLIVILVLKSNGLLDREAPETIDKFIGKNTGLHETIVPYLKRRMIKADLIDDKWQPLDELEEQS